METIISTKEVRNDLEGFLRNIQNGQVYKVMYRSKPIVTLMAKTTPAPHTAVDAGTPLAGKRSVDYSKSLHARPKAIDQEESFKQLYKNMKYGKYDTN